VSLPVTELHDDLLDELRAEHHELVKQYNQLAGELVQAKALNAWYEEQFRLSRARRFGPSSEKTPEEQRMFLFNEAEAFSDGTAETEDTADETAENEQAAAPQSDQAQSQKEQKSPKRKGHRDAQLNGLRQVTIPYVLPPDQMSCPQCGQQMHQMSTQVRREVRVIPAEAYVVNHEQAVCTCRNCQQNEIRTPVVTAPMPVPAFPGSIASASLVSYIIAQKFVMSLPLYRLEANQMLKGLDISRATMANWMIKAAGWLAPIIDRLHQILLTGDIIQADETTLQVLHEEGRSPQTDSYMFLYRSCSTRQAIVLYEYARTRNAERPKTFLAGFCGFLQTDGLDDYKKVPCTISVGCMAHARRRFDEAVKAVPPKDRKPTMIAMQGLAFCNELYAIERKLKDASYQERYEVRFKESKPLVDAFRTWLDEKILIVTPKSVLGAAIGYCIRQWEALTAYLVDGRLEIDNNRSERSIKPFVIGRKNWLFANTPKGAEASAALYSIVETAKENGLDPRAYIEQLLLQLPQIDLNDQTAIDALLPWSEAVPRHCRSPQPAAPSQ
jgi:transposase